MRLAHAASVQAPLSRVVSVLHQWELWPEWLPGVTAAGSGRGEHSLELVWTSVRPVKMRLDLRLLESGLTVDLIEGEIAALTGRVEASPGLEQGCDVRWELALVLADPLPGPLSQEIEAHMLRRWHACLRRRCAP